VRTTFGFEVVCSLITASICSHKVYLTRFPQTHQALEGKTHSVVIIVKAEISSERAPSCKCLKWKENAVTGKVF
jgi:hypothetical protein